MKEKYYLVTGGSLEYNQKPLTGILNQGECFKIKNADIYINNKKIPFMYTPDDFVSIVETNEVVYNFFCDINSTIQKLYKELSNNQKQVERALRAFSSGASKYIDYEDPKNVQKKTLENYHELLEDQKRITTDIYINNNRKFHTLKNVIEMIPKIDNKDLSNLCSVRQSSEIGQIEGQMNLIDDFPEYCPEM